MKNLKKAAAVAAMVGGLGLVGGGVASAACSGDSDGPASSAADNVQVVGCEQEFDGGLAFAPLTTATGDVEQNIGNFCTVVGSVGD